MKFVFNVDTIMVMMMFIGLVNLIDDEEDSKGYKRLCDGVGRGMGTGMGEGDINININNNA